MRVFVVGTGRCGSMTAAAAFSHATNFTASHEGRADATPMDRLRFEDRHIEVDNRLSWFLGPLHERYPDARYIHLTRDVDAVVASFLRRWPAHKLGTTIRQAIARQTRASVPSAIMPAFAHALMLRHTEWPPAEREAVVRFYVHTVTSNIVEFLKDKPAMRIELETAQDDFAVAWRWLKCTGDLELALAEWRRKHNASG